MRSALIVRYACVAVAVLCMAAAYALFHFWMAVPGMALSLLLLIAGRRSSPFWTESSILAVYVFLSLIGIISTVPPLLLVTGCTAALAAWDLGTLRDPSIQEPSRVILERRRLRLLGQTSLISLLFAGMSILFQIRLAFGVVLLLVLLLTGSILYSVRRLRDPYENLPSQR